MAINSNVGGPKATKHANNRQGGARKKIADTLQIIRAPKNAGQKRRRAELIHNGLRRICQLSFFLAFPAVFNASFNGIKYVFSQLGSQQPIELTGFVALLLAILAFTCVFGRFFCGYACAFGTLGDAVFALARPLRRALKLEGRGAHRLPAGAQSALRNLCPMLYRSLAADIGPQPLGLLRRPRRAQCRRRCRRLLCGAGYRGRRHGVDRAILLPVFVPAGRGLFAFARSSLLDTQPQPRTMCQTLQPLPRQLSCAHPPRPSRP